MTIFSILSINYFKLASIIGDCGKGDSSQRAKLPVYWSNHAPTPIYGHKLWVMTKRKKCIQAGKGSFPMWVSWPQPDRTDLGWMRAEYQRNWCPVLFEGVGCKLEIKDCAQNVCLLFVLIFLWRESRQKIHIICLMIQLVRLLFSNWVYCSLIVLALFDPFSMFRVQFISFFNEWKDRIRIPLLV